MKTLNEEDYKEFKNFENSLLNQEDGVKYKADDEINAIVRNDALTSLFGKEHFEFTMDKFGYSIDDLGKDENYNAIYEFLNRI